MRCATLYLVFIAASACSASPPAPAPSAISVSIDAPPQARATAPPASAARPMPTGLGRSTIALPQPIVCSFSSTKRAGERTELALVSGGKPFATVAAAKSIDVVIGEGPASLGLTIDADAGGVLVRGIASAGTIRFHATRVSVFGGVVVPSHGADLLLSAASKDALEMQLVLPDALWVNKKTSVVGPLPCSITSLDYLAFDAFETLLGKPIEGAQLKGQEIQLAESASGAPSAVLLPRTADPRRVAVLARDAKRVKIAWPIGRVIAFGWVDAHSLGAGPIPEHGFEVIGLGSFLGRSRACCDTSIVCDEEIALRAEVDGRSEIVGVVAPRTRMGVVGEREGSFDVELPSTGLEKPAGAAWLVAKLDVARCQRI